MWTLSKDVAGVYEVLAEVANTDAGAVFRPVVEDVEAMIVVLSAWNPDDVDMELLAEARQRLDSARMKDL